ncbi:MAG TPA: asparagine synthase (glutamine-hydrolyzing) [Acetobacteraceae bacterium]|nr:asparagine synthase (glutamine-hydrolyzing) [Acetobacteraceae bacterium]
MCGIAGLVSYNRDLTAAPEKAILAAMTKTMELRGPDAGGLWTDRHVGLGHRRLAVIDVEGGVQPMQAEEEGQVVATLIFAGEIYNFIELRQALVALGHRFKTRSDTEVILRSYLQWGADAVERFNGMFSFAIWDTRTEELLLVRDRMGVKPLFYYPMQDGVLFGSEPKAILAHPSVRPEVDMDGLREVLVLVKNPERTAYAGMHEVRPGQIVRVSRSGLTKTQYWQLTAREHEHDLPRTIQTVAELLDDIVRHQIITDVPLCSLLSGGLDSSAVTALADRAIRAEQGAHIRSFSVDFVNQDQYFVPGAFHKTSDTPFVRDFVRHVGSDHTEVVLDSRELANDALNRAVVRACDFSPNTSGDMFNSLYRLCETIKRRSTVALSGESADEIFGGYPWFHDPQRVHADTYPWLATLGAAAYSFDVLDQGLLEQLSLPEFEAQSYAQAIAEVPRLEGETPAERRMREISYLHLTRFVQFLLDRKDRMSMAVGLEVRVPFCDHRLVDYVFNIPWHMKSYDGREKSILRAAVQAVLPNSILERQKSPYPSTQDPTYEQTLREHVAAIVSDRTHPLTPLLNRKGIEEMLARPIGNASSLGQRAGLERARSLAIWFKEYGVSLAA